MQKIYLISHTGGDGANFIMSLLTRFSNRFNKSFIRTNENNNYINDHIFTSNNNLEITKHIDLNIENNVPYNKGLKLKNDDGIQLQQMHSDNKKLKDNLSKYFNNDSFLCIKTTDIDTQFLFAKLNIIKNKHIVNEQYFRSKNRRRQFIFGMEDETYKTQYNINYNKLILEADYNEFTKLCNFFKEETTLEQDKFKELVNNYANSNKKLLDNFPKLDEYYKFFTTGEKEYD